VAMRGRGGPGEAEPAARAMWGMGDDHRFARATVWELGPELVRACGIGPGTRVLDVGAGSGNVALRATEAGASVVASDLSPAGFGAGRREAAALGVEVEWVEADAQALPFPDRAFDAVTSCFGAMFAPDHHAVAREAARVCRPGARSECWPSGPLAWRRSSSGSSRRASRRPLRARPAHRSSGVTRTTSATC
jgi:SAM-dependent methyltransferase